MLALLAALHLGLVKDADITGIWYGEFDPDSKQAPVRDLSGLLYLADWLQALATYDKDGDYGVFASLLGDAGKALRQAAFFERTTNPVKARQCLTGWKDQIAGNPVYDLFRDELHHRIAWWRQGKRPHWEAVLARHCLKRGDYLRATIYGLEAVVSSRTSENGNDPNAYESREAARKQLLETSEMFRSLNDIRNAMAHGTLSGKYKTVQALVDEAKLTTTLETLFDPLLPS